MTVPLATPDFVTVEEYAEMARTVPSTIRYWRAQGKGPAGIKRGKRVLYPRGEVIRWLNGEDLGQATP